MALSLGLIYNLVKLHLPLRINQYLEALAYLFVIGSVLFLFGMQNTKNGIAYAAILIILFLILILLKAEPLKPWYKITLLMISFSFVVTVIYPHLQKNDSWRSLIADTKVGFDLERYHHWKYVEEQGLPPNDLGKIVSGTNYLRAAWFKAGLQLVISNPLGYGLVEDSFKNMAKAKWPDVSKNLTHSHSGWLDLILGIGIPGFLCILSAMILCIKQCKEVRQPWKSIVFWALIANIVLWITTEVAATISLSALVFWVSWACGLTLIKESQMR